MSYYISGDDILPAVDPKPPEVAGLEKNPPPPVVCPNPPVPNPNKWKKEKIE